MKQQLTSDVFRELIKLVRPAETRLVTVVGHSMNPTFLDGDTLIVDPPQRPLHIGDVVVYPHRGKLVVHRVIECLEDRLICAGDASWALKEEVAPDDVIGVVRCVLRGQKVVAKRASSFWRANFVRLRLAYRFYQKMVLKTQRTGIRHEDR